MEIRFLPIIDSLLQIPQLRIWFPGKNYGKYLFLYPYTPALVSKCVFISIFIVNTIVCFKPL